MARQARLILAGVAQWINLRGHNNQAVFAQAEDLRYFLHLLHEGVLGRALQLHAYALVPCAVQLLLTPQNPQDLISLIQSLGRHYVPYFNRRYDRSGSLWEGRYNNAPMQNSFVLPTMVYMDSMANEAGLLHAAHNQCSSYGCYVGARRESWVSPPDVYWQLGNTPFARESAYAALVEQGLDASTKTRLQAASRSCWPVGDAAFLAQLQKADPKRRLEKQKAGRPRKMLPAIPG